MNNLKQLNWKKFIKPTKLKIFIFFLLPGIQVSYISSATQSAPWSYVYNVYPIFILFKVFLLELFQSPYSDLKDGIGNFARPTSIIFNTSIQIILNIIVLYSISCLLNHVIYKFRNKNFKPLG